MYFILLKSILLKSKTKGELVVFIRKAVYVLWASVVFSLSGGLAADETVALEKPPSGILFNSEAHARVQKITQDLIVMTEAKGTLLESDPEAYFSAVDDVLEPVVDYAFIARVVMGRYGKAATLEQKKEFEAVFRRGLVMTYARGMASFAEQDITILPPENDVSHQRRVSVRQQVRADKGDVHILSYTMAQQKSGDWKLINVVMDGINLGKTFRSQFEQAVKKNNGDIDGVIQQWLAVDA